jgi:diguanylate cyclase (GGDEF)-like protein
MTLSSGTGAPKSDRPAFSRQLFLDGVHEASRANRSLAILVVDLDRFRRINDAFGRNAGNEVLREAATRIGKCVRDAGRVSRLGGDEFAVLLESVESPGLADTIADGIRSEINRPFLIEDREVYLSASVGIALAPRDGGSAEELLQRADLAMSQAKKLGGNNRQAYSPGSETRISAKLDMEARLRRALELGGLEVHYQPQASLADGAIHSVEALLRWNDPELGWVSPAEFIPLAEETGLIHRIGAWVLETASAQATAWQAAGLCPFRVCVNVSARQLNQDLAGTVSRVLARTGLSPSLLELEITESVLMPKDPGTEAALGALRALGIGFALDDFGTGYATFDYLKRLPVRTLKLDGSFVRGVCGCPDDAAIVTASISLAHSLGIRVVAEGIETAEQRERLRKLGCDDCQGYHTCRPLPAKDIEDFLRASCRDLKTERPRLTVAR